MQTRLIKNAQRKQTVFLHHGIYRWTNFLIRHSLSRKRSMFLPCKFLLYFFFFIPIKKNFLLSNTLFNVYSIKHFNFTFSPYIYMLFSKLFQKIPKIPRLTIYLIYLFFFFFRFIFLQRSRYSILKRLSLNLDTISSSIFSLVSRSREGEKRTKPGNLGTWRVGSGGVSLAPPLLSSLPRFARCWPYAFLPRSRCCTWLELG